MRVIALIQTRFNSARLPGKALMDLNGMPVIQHIYRRLLGCRMVDEVSLCIGVQKPPVFTMTEYEEWAKVLHLPSFLGSQEDILQRMISAARWFRGTAILRITGDCWAHDPRLLDDMIRFFLDGYPHIQGVCNWNPRTYSEGVDAEIYTMELLNKLDKDPNCHREGFATYAVAHMMMANYKPNWPPQYGAKEHLSIDVQADLDLARKILEKIGNNCWSYDKTMEAYHELTG